MRDEDRALIREGELLDAAVAVAQQHLAVWWAARLAYMTGHFASTSTRVITDQHFDQWADTALDAYIAKESALTAALHAAHVARVSERMKTSNLVSG